MCVQDSMEALAAGEAARAGYPVAAVSDGMVVLGIPGGGGLSMPASVALDAATALLAVADCAVSCWACRYIAACRLFAGVRAAANGCTHVEDVDEPLARVLAGACQLFTPGEGA